jgi:monofunctional biosynthetic peptidoglycan transglycosylase
VDDSAHGDEPAEPKDAGPAKARPDMPLREPVAGAIPTVAPHPPRVPSQVPPWLEDTVTAGTPGDVPTAAADVPARVQDAMGPPPEVPVTPVTLEPSSPPPAEVADDDGLAEARAVNPAPEMPDQSAALELPALPADASDVGSREAHTTESELEVVAEPDQDAALTSQDVPPERVEGFLAAPFVGEAPVVPSPDFSHRAEADTERDAFPPIVPDIDILPAPPRESVDNAQPNALVSEVSAFDEGIWRDTAEVQQTVPALAVDAATQIIDTPPPAQQPAPIREEQIWSVPQTVDPSLQWPEPERTDPQREPPFEVNTPSEPEPLDDQHAPQAASVSGVETPAQAPSLVPSPLAAAWPSTSIPAPARGRVGEPVRYLRLAFRIAGGIVLALTATVLLLVVLYRWVDPPASTLMLGQQLTGTEIEQRWVPIERISPHLVQAVILSEDGGFCRHRGVDWPALEEAIESSRGGSTITMQVVKNLFLWPSRSYIRKALEIVLAYVVEAVWPKERVLEIYLNIAEWGPGIFGAEAAARSHFGRSASQLTPQEAALLAVSLPSPIERRAGYPDQQMRRLANNLQLRMRAVRSVPQCVRVRRAGG